MGNKMVLRALSRLVNSMLIGMLGAPTRTMINDKVGTILRNPGLTGYSNVSHDSKTWGK